VIDGFTTSELEEIERAHHACNFYPGLVTVLEMEPYHLFLATAKLAFGLNMSGHPVDKAGSDDQLSYFWRATDTRHLYSA
jgi:hypothetical protein